jgi:transcriptional regulator with XRE-family HTH domain
MVDEIDDNDLFSTALKSLTDKLGRGCQNTLSIATGLEAGYISQLKNGKRKASVKTQIKIAKALGYRHIDFLSLGQEILIGQRTDIALRDIAAEHFMSSWPFEIQAACRTVKKILESGDKDTAEALIQNIHAFEESIDRRKAISDLHNEVNSLKHQFEEFKRIQDLKIFTGTD